MRLLLCKDLDTHRVKPAFAKVRAAIEAGDFRSADIKKLAPTRYWRAKLDYSNRLLLQFARCGDETVCLALEVIENHAYDKSRFLRGASVDESKVEREPALANGVGGDGATDAVPMRWLHASRAEFELLDKPIMFDDAQEAVRRLPAPVVVVVVVVVVGSAGSGKTAITLAKLREAEGRVLYVTQSAYLAQGARALYDAHGHLEALAATVPAQSDFRDRVLAAALAQSDKVRRLSQQLFELAALQSSSQVLHSERF